MMGSTALPEAVQTFYAKLGLVTLESAAQLATFSLSTQAASCHILPQIHVYTCP